MTMRFLLCILVCATALRAQTAPPSMRLVETLRIRGNENDIPGPIPQMVVQPNGGVVIFDASNARFVFFDSTGKRLGTVGRRGEGPGEFAAQTGTAISPSGVRTTTTTYNLTVGLLGDSVWVYDRMRRRFTVFSPQRRVVRTAPMFTFDPATVAAFEPLAYYSNGSAMGEIVFGGRVEYTEPDGDKGSWYARKDSAIVMARPPGSVQHRLLTMPLNSRYAGVSRPGTYSVAIVPFAVGPLRDVVQSGDRVLYVTHAGTTTTGGTYRVLVVRSNGDTVVSRTYPFMTAPIERRRTDSAYGATETRLRGSTTRDARITDELLQQIRANIPSVQPPFHAAMLGMDGTIWLTTRLSPDQPLLVLDATGNPVATAVLPRPWPTMVLREATRNTLWVTEIDADGFVDVVRYRLDPIR
jgi:hypothetical protein